MKIDNFICICLLSLLLFLFCVIYSFRFYFIIRVKREMACVLLLLCYYGRLRTWMWVVSSSSTYKWLVIFTNRSVFVSIQTCVEWMNVSRVALTLSTDSAAVDLHVCRYFYQISVSTRAQFDGFSFVHLFHELWTNVIIWLYKVILWAGRDYFPFQSQSGEGKVIQLKKVMPQSSFCLHCRSI